MKIRQIIITALITILVVTALATLILAEGQDITSDLNTTGESLLTTSGITNAIWVPIYLMLIFFAIYQMLPASKTKDFIDSAFPWLSIALVSNIIWWAVDFLQVSYVGPILLAVIIGSLSMSYYFLNYYLPKFKRFELEDRVIVYGTVSLYLGWTIIVFLEQLSEMLIEVGITELLIPTVFWGVLMMILVTILAIYFLLLQLDLPLGVAILWGIYGINSHRGIYSTNNNNLDTTYLNYTFWACAALILISMGLAIYQWNQRRAAAELQDSYF